MTQVKVREEKSSKLVKGIVIGGIVGGVISLLDTTTRNQVKNTAVDLKESSKEIFDEVRENPGEVKNQMITQFTSASETLKNAINDAQKLYQRINNDVFGKVNDVVEITNETLSTAKQATEELSEIGSKVKEAGAELTEPLSDDEGEKKQNSSLNQGAPPHVKNLAVKEHSYS
ncbi:YtxH domain-containing protein [Bacillus sp. CGMCC 1.16541]|uniref:YtxH domain-containing protein n=1 Tax=Bacillus sp. CGMCC 1.16541 TaxID=2185143 RepID=UPI000D73B175|nr:YtxH domain-containing protein [Bacillus sp. CGMCC 1.16541]